MGIVIGLPIRVPEEKATTSKTRSLALVVWVLLAFSQLLQLASCKAPLYRVNDEKRIPQQYIVVLKKDVDTDDAIEAFKDSSDGGLNEDQIGHRYRKLHGFCSRLSETSLSKLLDSDMVAYIEEDQVFKATALASWGLDRVDQRDLPVDNGTRNYLGNGTGVHIYVIDTGVDYSHPDFAGRTGDGYDFINMTADVGKDCDGHGTHCAGTAAGTTFGVATHATVHDIRVLGCDGSSTASSVIAGMEWVAENHTKPAVVSMSLGGGFSQADNDAVKMLFDAGVVVSTAAGNSELDACESSPGSAPEAINVGATDIEDEKVYWSNFGKCVDIFAPGVRIPSANYWNDTEPLVYSGTSMACPHLSGAAAILLGIDPSLTPQNVTDLLLRGATRNKVKDAHFLSPNRLLYIGMDTCMMHCGSIVDESRDCQCDTECSNRGDCCYDYTYLCWEIAPTCSERCGENSTTFPCQCDQGCFSREDCCQDYAIQCKPNLPCDSTHDHPGLYYSPYYPDDYLNDQTCRTLITIPQSVNSSLSLLIIVSDFHLEDSVNCSRDSLTFYAGDNEDSPMLGSYCGMNVPLFVPGGRNTTAVFRTDSNITATGYRFRVIFAEVSEDIVTTPGVIMSENFPSNYTDDRLTITKIYAPPGEQIVLDFTHFDVEGNVYEDVGLYCWDTLSFYDSDSPLLSDLIGEACTDSDGDYNIAKFSPLKSGGNSLLVVFQSDGYFNRMGYKATVTSVKSCDSTLSRPGTISSSNYPSVYYNNERCYTNIRATRGKQVVVTFTDFEVQGTTDGICHDYLKAYNGISPDENNLIGVFCGSSALQIRSIGRNLLLEFGSDFEYSARGYKADVTFVQGVTAKLLGGKTPSQGRVEIAHNKYGKGSVCDDSWDIKDASVVCKMLGYGAARDAPRRAYFGQGNGPVLLNNMDCSGSEFNVDQCEHSQWRPRTCSHRQDASAICYEKGEVPLPIRLMDGDVPNAGRVELRIGDEWGTVCGNGWDFKDAEVVCRNLGFYGAVKVLGTGDVSPGNASYPIFFDDVKCDGDESGIEFCRHSGVGNHDCDHAQDVGVHGSYPDEFSRKKRDIKTDTLHPMSKKKWKETRSFLDRPGVFNEENWMP